MTTERQRDALQANLNEWRVWAKGHAGMDLPGDSDEDIRRMLSGRLVDGVSLDEHERVKAAKKVLRSRDHLDAVQLQWERWARDLSGLSKASPVAVRARLSSLINSLAEYRELAMDIGDVKDHGTPDAELRAAVRATLSRGGICLNEYTRVVMLLGEYREMCRDVIGVERSNFTDAELRAALVAEVLRFKGLLDTCEELLGTWRTRAIGLLGYGTFARWGGDDAGLWKRLLQKFAGDSTTPVRALLALAMGVEPGDSLVAALDRFERLAAEARQAIVAEGSRAVDRGRASGIEARLNMRARPSDVYKPDDAYMEAFRAGWDAIDGQLRHVYDRAIAEGRRLEREEADKNLTVDP